MLAQVYPACPDGGKRVDTSPTLVSRVARLSHQLRWGSGGAGIPGEWPGVGQQYKIGAYIVNSCVLVTTASRVRAGIVLCECSNAMCLRVHSCKSKSREVCIH